jgi:hypothetical protein
MPNFHSASETFCGDNLLRVQSLLPISRVMSFNDLSILNPANLPQSRKRRLVYAAAGVATGPGANSDSTAFLL